MDGNFTSEFTVRSNDTSLDIRRNGFVDVFIGGLPGNDTFVSFIFFVKEKLC